MKKKLLLYALIFLSLPIFLQAKNPTKKNIPPCKKCINNISSYEVLDRLSHSKSKVKATKPYPTSFGSNNIMLTDFKTILGTGSADSANDVAIQTDGKIVTGGFSNATDHNFNFILVRYNANGTVDTSFGKNGVVNTDIATALGVGSDSTDSINSIAIQNDGKILAAGFSNALNPNFDFAIARYNTDGTLDTTFGTGDFAGKGIVLTNIGTVVGTDVDTVDSALDVIIQPDNKILVGGYSTGTTATDTGFAICRYEVNGSLDAGFGTNGAAVTNFGDVLSVDISSDVLNSLALNSSNQIIAGGSTNALDPNGDFALARYETDGTLDTTFGTNGVVVTDIGANSEDSIGSIAVQSDDKIVVAGYTNTTSSVYDFAVGRYNTDGSVDNIVTTNIGTQAGLGTSTNNAANSIQILSDGKILAGGSTNALESSNLQFAFVKYNTDLTVDTTYQVNGVIITNIQSQVDPNFPASCYVNNFALLPGSDAFIACGGTNATDLLFDFSVAKYAANGNVDTSFGGGVIIVNTDIEQALGVTSGSQDTIASLALQSTQKIVTGGYSTALNPNYDFSFARYNQNGSLDDTFGFKGLTLYSISTRLGIPTGSMAKSRDILTSIAIQKDDGIVAGGYTNALNVNSDISLFAVANLNKDGLANENFGTNGFTVTDVGQVFIEETGLECQINSIAIQDDGKIIAGGFLLALDVSFFALARYNTNGTLDTTFGKNGVMITNISLLYEQNPTSSDYITSIAIQSDGKILAGGASSYQTAFFKFAIVRYNTNGTVDTTFGNNGAVLTDFATLKSPSAAGINLLNGLVIQPDGKIIAAGSTTAKNLNFNVHNPLFAFGLAKYNTNGSLDTTFGKDGIVITDFSKAQSSTVRKSKASTNNNDLLFSVALAANGNIVTGGASDATNPFYDFALAVYNNNGKLSSNFGNEGLQLTNFRQLLGLGSKDTSSISPNSIAINASGHILAGGGSNALDKNYDFALSRYALQNCISTTDLLVTGIRDKY